LANTIDPGADAATNPMFDPKPSVVGIAANTGLAPGNQDREE